MNDYTAALCKRIRKNLSDLLSQEENTPSLSRLSRQIGRDESYLRGLLSGRFMPSLKALADISHALHVSIHYFFLEQTENAPVRKKLSAILSCLPDEDCEVLLKLAERLSDRKE